MIVSRRVAWVILLGALLTAGVLRQFHEKIPTSPFLPVPVGSLLFFLVLILFLVFARGWGRRQEIPYAGSGLREVNFLAMLPFLLALMLEKWASITLFGPLFDFMNRHAGSASLYDALYRLESGCGLMLVSVLLLPLFRRLLPLLKNFLKPKRVPIALLGLAVALAGLYGGLALLFLLASGQWALPRWAGFGRFTGLVLVGQALIAFAEEFYYRGILQSELAFLLPALGLGKERLRVGAAVGLISAAFAAEHFQGSGSSGQDLRRLLFTFASSLFLGVLLVLMENLWFSAGCHFMLNIFVLGPEVGVPGGGLQYVENSGRPLFEAPIYVFLFFILAFVVAYLRHALYKHVKRRRGPVAAH